MRMPAFVAAALFAAGIGFAGSAAAEVATGNVNMRSGPGTGYARVGVVPRGGYIDVLTCRGNWCQVVYRGQRGWVSANFIGGGPRYAEPDYGPVYVEPPIYAEPPIIIFRDRDRDWPRRHWDHDGRRDRDHDRHRGRDRDGRPGDGPRGDGDRDGRRGDGDRPRFGRPDNDGGRRGGDGDRPRFERPGGERGGPDGRRGGRPCMPGEGRSCD